MAEKEQAKRRVKNPETFRERAIKASEAEEQPSKRSRVRSAVGTAVSPVGRAYKKFTGLRILKPFRKPARIVGKILVPPYIRNSFRELKLVSWPSWNESRRLTTAVLIFAILFGGIIALVDFGLDKLFRNILLK